MPDVGLGLTRCWFVDGGLLRGNVLRRLTMAVRASSSSLGAGIVLLVGLVDGSSAGEHLVWNLETWVCHGGKFWGFRNLVERWDLISIRTGSERSLI